jgi:Tol biopolymer transport system component
MSGSLGHVHSGCHCLDAAAVDRSIAGVSPAESTCTSCHTPLPADAQFCPRCGTRTPTEISAGGTTTGAVAAEQTAEQQRRIQAALGPDYDVQRRIGSGGFAEVWAAFDRRLQRTVAVKVLHPDLVATHALLERFQREAQAVAKLRHPGVIPIYAVGEYEGLAYYIMPLVEGESLRERLSREGALPPDEVRRILRETAAALAVAHDAGIVHRDIKPENLMLEGKERRVLVMDFGIAKSTAETQAGLTGTGMIIGTPAYMSPEQATGSKEIDARSDVYSLGVVGYELLTGKPPFTAPSVPELIVQHVTTLAPSVAKASPDAPEDLVVAIDRCLAKDPAERWANAGAFAASLAGAAPVVAARPQRQRLGRGARRIAAISSVAIGVSAVAAVVWWAPWRQRATSGRDVKPRQVTFRGDVCGSSISPDGRYLTYFAAEQFWLFDLDRDRAWPVSDSVPEFGCSGWRSDQTPRWTDDGQALVFVHGDSTYRAGTGGDRARPVGAATVADSLTSRAGRIIGTDNPQGSDTTSWPGLTVRTLGHDSRRVPLTGFRLASTRLDWISPDGSRVLVAGIGGEHLENLRFLIVDLDSGRVVPIDSGIVHGLPWGWSPDGQALYSPPGSGPGLLRFALDHARLRLSGRITTLVPGVLGREEGVQFEAGGFARVRNRMAFQRTQLGMDVIIGHLAQVGPQRHWSLERVAPGSLVPSSATMTPGADRLLFVAKADSFNSLFEMAMPSGAPRRLARLSDVGVIPLRLSPDGSTAVLGISNGKGWHSVLVDLRSGTSRDLPGWGPRDVISWNCEIFDWDPTGRIVFAGGRSYPSVGIVRMNAVSGVTDTLRADSSARVACPAASPDGRWVAVRYVKLPRDGMLLLPLAGDSARFFAAPKLLYPLGWLSAGEIVALEDPAASADSSEVWVYSLAGRRSLLGKLPSGCGNVHLAPGRRDVVCIAEHNSTDVWVADGFDPYFHPPLASTPRR